MKSQQHAAFLMRMHWLACFSLFAAAGFAQVPTDQDCLGAIPICGPVYTTPSSTFGSGNYPNEDGPGTCLVPGESNSLWFVFTVINSGDLAFTITPVNANADYDWALYNLTGQPCSAIPTNGSLLSSCNSSQYGITGISSTGIGNYNGPGFTNAFNYLLPVSTGQTYVLNVNNWSGSTGGYTIDFGASTATIFDSVAPHIDTVTAPVCTDATIQFSFSENVLCSSVQDADFAFAGPWSNYTISNVVGAACQSGGTQEYTFTADINPPILHGGTYTLYLTTNAGGVEDLCGNVSLPDTFSFLVNGVDAVVDSVVSPYCAGNNGLIYGTGVSGLLPYSFDLNGVMNTTGNYLNLSDTTYTLTVTDAGGCFDTAMITLYPANGVVHAVLNQYTDVQCFDSCDGTILVSGSGGLPPYQYQWNNGATAGGIFGLCPGNYEVLITDSIGCQDSVSITINQPVQFHFTLDSIKDPLCYAKFDGYVGMHVTGGTPIYHYTWLPYGGNQPVTSSLDANTYTLEVQDANGCIYDTSVTLNQPDPLVIHYPGDTVICSGTDALLQVPVTGGTPGYQAVWNTGVTVIPLLFSTDVDTAVAVYVIDTNGCTSPQVTYRIQVLHPLAVDLGNDTTLCAGDVLYKNVFQPGALYQWQDGSSFYDYSIKEQGLYYVNVYNACFEATDTVNIEVDDCETCVHVPNAFTPNGDGLNDLFQPEIGCYFTNYLFKVFNRWGQLVYQSEDPDAGWDGKYNGHQEEVGTYIWQLQYAGSEHDRALSEILKGFVTLIR